MMDRGASKTFTGSLVNCTVQYEYTKQSYKYSHTKNQIHNDFITCRKTYYVEYQKSSTNHHQYIISNGNKYGPAQRNHHQTRTFGLTRKTADLSQMTMLINQACSLQTESKDQYKKSQVLSTVSKIINGSECWRDRPEFGCDTVYQKRRCI